MIQFMCSLYRFQNFCQPLSQIKIEKTSRQAEQNHAVVPFTIETGRTTDLTGQLLILASRS